MTVRTLALILVVALLPILAACSESITSAQAQSAELAQIQQQLASVIERLDAIERDHAERLGDLRTELLGEFQDGVAGISTLINELSLDVGASVGVSAAVEGSICSTTSYTVSAAMGAKLAARGQADGMVGVDAYGNGATARLRAMLEPDAGVGFSPATSLQMQLCGKLTGQTGVDGGVTIDPSDPIIALLEGLTGSVRTSQLVSVASGLDMGGARSADALNQLSNLSPSGQTTSFLNGGASSLANALPMPSDMRSRIANPSSLLSEAGSLGQASVDLLCSQGLRQGEFAAAFTAGCNLRDQVPAPGEVIGILSNLQSFGSALGTLENNFAALNNTVGSVCSTVGGMANANLTIPSRSVTILNTSYTTFPGYSAPLFPNIGAPC